jgi:DNA-binding FadR family transcriptional regulator
VQAAFGTVVWVVCGLAIVIGIAALVVSGKTWEDFGKGLFVRDQDLPRGPRPDSTAALLERDTEIRELLEARNARRRRRGEPPIDVEREFARLTAPRIDPELEAEIRQLVIARNNRRARLGKPPLDVEAEVSREIEKLGEL